ncbi:MAG: hypothetical protein HRT68_12560 [Flavobacteriaceae bacterium]|nr:hypothetical protein [Flavobacteriaceae bacterium]
MNSFRLHSISLAYGIVFLVLLNSCSTTVSKESLHHLNGYWQITKVEAGDQTREYPPALQADYFYVNESFNGYRKKLSPQINGKFLKNNSQEDFKLNFVEDLTYIAYSNNLSNWQELIIAVSEEELILQNEEGIRYHYIRFKPIEIE